MLQRLPIDLKIMILWKRKSEKLFCKQKIGFKLAFGLFARAIFASFNSCEHLLVVISCKQLQTAVRGCTVVIVWWKRANNFTWVKILRNGESHIQVPIGRRQIRLWKNKNKINESFSTPENCSFSSNLAYMTSSHWNIEIRKIAK